MFQQFIYIQINANYEYIFNTVYTPNNQSQFTKLIKITTAFRIIVFISIFHSLEWNGNNLITFPI